MKNIRQEKILEIIDKYEVETQEELVDRLIDAGINAAQATVSRDIKQLNLVKIIGSHGQYKYSAQVSGKVQAVNYSHGLYDAIIKTDHANNMAVIHTIPGMANAVAAYIDHLGMADVLGSIAGDDTIFVMLRSERAAAILGEKIDKLLSTL